MPRDVRSDPFTPGGPPRILAGRSTEFNDLTRVVVRLAAGVSEPPRLITGTHGTGKTSLLLRFEREQREAGRWVVAGLSRLPGITVATEGRSPSTASSASTGDRLRDVLIETSRLAREHATVLVLLIDDAHRVDRRTLRHLAAAVAEVRAVTIVEREPETGAVRHEALPLAVVSSGPPRLAARLASPEPTLAQRPVTHRLGALARPDLLVALRDYARAGGAAFDADAIDAIVDASGGHPYLLHVVGSHVWRAGTADVIDLVDARAGIEAAGPYLRAFYDQRIAEIGELQRAYLRAAASIPLAERTPGNVAAALGRTSDRIGSTLAALVSDHGLLQNDGTGRLAFALPGLDRYLAGAAP